MRIYCGGYLMKIKTTIASIFFTLLIVILSFNAQIFAAQKTVELNGGMLVDGRTLVPMRSLFETLGAKVNWNGTTKTVTAIKEDITIKLTVNSKKVYVNSNTITLDSVPKVINSQTMVPVRFVSETLGAKVSWDSASSIVTVETDEQLI